MSKVDPYAAGALQALTLALRAAQNQSLPEGGGGSGDGDMLKSVYDPTNIEADAFDYNNFINTPVLFDGDYNSLSNLPNLFDGDYDSLSNLPNLSIYATINSLGAAAFSNDYNDLDNIPVSSAYSGPTLITPFGSVSQAGTGTLSATISHPSGLTTGDLKIIVCETANETVDTPSGWTALANGSGSAGAADATRLTIFYQVHSGQSEPTLTSTGSIDHFVGRMFLVRGGTTVTSMTNPSIVGTSPIRLFNGFSFTANTLLISLVALPLSSSAANCTLIYLRQYLLNTVTAAITSTTQGNDGAIYLKVAEVMDNLSSAGAADHFGVFMTQPDALDSWAGRIIQIS